MKTNTIFLTTIMLVAVGCQKQEKLAYPPTEKIEFSEILHGQTIQDPYRWLEEMTSAKVKEWVSSQDKLLKQTLHDNDIRPRIEKRIGELRLFSSYTSPIQMGKHYYYTKTEATKSRAVLYSQKELTGKAVAIFDPEKSFSDTLRQIHTLSGGNSLGYEPSPDGQKMILSLSDGRSRWYSLHVYDLPSMKESFVDSLVGIHNLSGAPQWSGDNSGFYYVKYDLPAKGDNLLKATAKNPIVYFHKLGTRQSSDVRVFKMELPGNWIYGLEVTGDGRYLIIDVRDGTKNENAILVKSLQSASPIRPLLDNNDGNYTFLGSKADDFFFYTNHQAPRGRIIGINLLSNKRYEIVPQANETISGGSAVGGNALGFYGNRFVITYIKDGVPLLRGFDITGKSLYSASLPIDGSVWGGFVGNERSQEVFFNFLGFTSPSSIYKIDASTGVYELFKQAEIPFNSDNYTTKQVFYTSKDGTKVPMFISHRKDLKLDGTNPGLMYAYGAGGWISFLWYQEHLLAWLEMGGIYAQPSIRGGGEYGEDWHAAGVRHNRQNAVDDYHAAAEYLISNKYTSPELLAANGGSLSSALAGTVVMQRPELFGAMILDRPVLDMLRFTQFTNGSAWVNDLGDPEVKEDFKTLYSMSPYHLIQPGQCYPPSLVMVGDKDQVTSPAHAYKFTAALQQSSACANRVLLKMMWGVGHSFGNTPAETIDSRTDEIAFLVKVFKMKDRLNELHR